MTPVIPILDMYIKRDDTFNIANAWGGKARTCWKLAKNSTTGLVTAGSRNSPQINIVAHIAKELGLPMVAHCASGQLGEEITQAQTLGAEIIQHSPGYNSVIIKRALDDSIQRKYTYIPFGMECWEAVEETSEQVQNIPDDVKRIVMPVGSGMSLAGVLTGLDNYNKNIPVIGIVVGADPTKRLDKYAPLLWRNMVTLIPSPHKYEKHIAANLGDVLLDPVYEAKCAEFMTSGDLLWAVGIRTTKK
jgi:1-aminocyclopropane-1-carboxylate deaminase/D-cysteine desulfhydrase-like pyridoxal-dependent ACC family enzyme